MKKISLLQKPLASQINIRSLPLFRITDPLLEKLLASEPLNPAWSKASGFFNILDVGYPAGSKVGAITGLTELVEKENYYDPRLIPTFLRFSRDLDSELGQIALDCLIRISRYIPNDDDKLMRYFHGFVNNSGSTQAMWGLRVLLNRGAAYSPGLIPSIVNAFKNSVNFTQEAAGLAVVSSYLSQKQSGGISDLRILAELPNGKVYSRGTILIEGNKPCLIEDFIKTVVRNNAPELENLVIRKDDGLFFNTGILRAEALYRVDEVLELDKTYDPNLLPTLIRTSAAKENAIRINSIACVGELITEPYVLDTQAITLLQSKTEDPNDQVRSNVFQAMQLLSQRSSVLTGELEPYLISNLKKSEDPEVRIFTLQGIVSLLEQERSYDQGLPDLLIRCVEDGNTPAVVKAIALLALAKCLEITPIKHPKLNRTLIESAKSNEIDVRANAILGIANNIKQEAMPEATGLLITALSDQHHKVRANALLGVKHCLEREDLNHPNLETLIRDNLHDRDDLVRTNALYAFGNAISRQPVLALEQADLELLLHVASTDLYEPARAATYALSVIVNKDISKIDKPEYEDMVEILCIIFGGYLPGENDGYEKTIKSALEILEGRFDAWKRTIDYSDLSQRKAIRRLTLREELQNSALKQLSLRANELYLELQGAQRTIKSLEVKNLSLELRLQREREIRIKLEQSLNSLAIELERTLNPPAKSLNKFGAKTILWLLERAFKHQGFHLDRMYNDLRAKLIVGFLGKKPVQKVFGVSAQDADDIASGMDLFSPED